MTMKQQAIVSMDDTLYSITELIDELEEYFYVQDIKILEYYRKDNKYRLLFNLDDDTDLYILRDRIHDLDVDIEYL